MSSYVAVIKCEKCGKELARIVASHEDKPDHFVPQDIHEHCFELISMFCNDCLNGK